ncbi:MAG TPA: phosphomethylpyrimidine synthase ThiC, partial [Spirochaetota bacterium]|nr:phosphomethylpyrimidine synthase ThiC [Spirochaetota bacterium]
NKGNSREREMKMARARKEINWGDMSNLALDKSKVDAAIETYQLKKSSECSMCGEFCSFKRNY